MTKNLPDEATSDYQIMNEIMRDPVSLMSL